MMSRAFPSPASPAARRRRRAQGAWSIAEVTVASLMIAMLVSGVLALTGTVARSSDKHTTQAELADDARLAVDEMLSHLRGARLVLENGSVAGRSYATGDAAVVVEAPAYHPAAAGILLPGVSDRVAFRFDRRDGELVESIEPGAGSVRPSRSEKVLARGVADVAFSFRVCDVRPVQKDGSPIFTLSAPATETPAAFVNGVRAGCEATAGGSYRVIASDLRAGDEVQFLYPVSPAAGAAVLGRVTQVDVTLRMAARDSRQIERRLTLQGAARLRNRRP